MCFSRRSRRWDRAFDERDEGVWDLFHRETERTERPVPIVEEEQRDREVELERDEVPAGAER